MGALLLLLLSVPASARYAPCDRLDGLYEELHAIHPAAECTECRKTLDDLDHLGVNLRNRCREAAEQAAEALRDPELCKRAPGEELPPAWERARDAQNRLDDAILDGWRDPSHDVYGLQWNPDGGGVDVYEGEGKAPACRESVRRLLGFRNDASQVAKDLQEVANGALVAACPDLGRKFYRKATPKDFFRLLGE